MFGIYRLVLAILVVAEHFGGAGSVGNRAVVSFFILSGFLMTMLMDGPYRGRPAAFALNRFLRLYPSYWFFAAITAALLLVGFTSKLAILGFPPTAFDWLRQAAYLSYHKDKTLVPISWAVTNEIIMYALIGFGISQTKRRALLWLAASAALNVASWCLHLNGEFTYFRPQAALFPFALGACAWQFRDWVLPKVSWTVAIASLALLGSSFVQSSYHLVGWGADLLWVEYVTGSAILTLCLYRLGPLVSDGLQSAGLALVRLSYPIYLNHFAASMLVTPLGLPTRPAAAVVMIVAAIGGCVSYWLVDRPIEQLRTRVRGAGEPKRA